jgi:hypothetical protein
VYRQQVVDGRIAIRFWVVASNFPATQDSRAALRGGGIKRRLVRHDKRQNRSE